MKHYRHLFILLACSGIIFQTTFAQSPDWFLVQEEGFQLPYKCYSFELDEDGNAFALFELLSDTDLDPGPGIAMVNIANSNTVLVKYDNTGNYESHLTSADFGTDVHLSGFDMLNNELIVIGTYSGYCDFLLNNQQQETCDIGECGFVVMMNNNLQPQSFNYHINLEESNTEMIGVNWGQSNDEYCVIARATGEVDIDPDANAYSVVPDPGVSRYFIAGYLYNELANVAEFTLDDDDELSVADPHMLPDGSLIACGEVSTAMDLDLSTPGYETDLISLANSFVIRYDSNGDLMWNFFLPLYTGSLIDVPFCRITVDPSNGNFYLGSSHIVDVDIDPLGSSQVLPGLFVYDSFMAQYSLQTGQMNYFEHYIDNDPIYLRDMVLDDEKRPVVLLKFRSFFDFDTGPAEVLPESEEGYAILKLDADGNYRSHIELRSFDLESVFWRGILGYNNAADAAVCTALDGPAYLEPGSSDPTVTTTEMGYFMVKYSETPVAYCAEDLTGDGLINTGDLTFFLAQLGTTCPQFTQCIADINADGVVNTADLTILLSFYGESCS